nr:LysR family transcriptional regulator [Vibrio sinus]
MSLIVLLEGIETLLVLSKERTMSRTGSQLYISQSAVSKRISMLEKKLGKKLIEPDGRRIKLTNDARELINNIGPTFSELRGKIFDQQILEDSTMIRLDCSETLLAGYLSQVMNQYFTADKYIQLTTNHTPRIVEHVQSGLATLGFCGGHLPPHHGLMTFHLGNEPYYVVSREPLHSLPSQLITNDLNNPANSYQSAILASLKVEPIMEMDSYTAAAQLGLGGVAPALVPLSVIRTLNIAPQFVFPYQELDLLVRPIHICLRTNSYQSDRVKKLIATIEDAVPQVVSLQST